jgi:hypothetical protein
MKMKKAKPLVITAQQQFAAKKPRYNAYQTGYGAHTSKKVYRRRPKHKGAEPE